MAGGAFRFAEKRIKSAERIDDRAKSESSDQHGVACLSLGDPGASECRLCVVTPKGEPGAEEEEADWNDADKPESHGTEESRPRLRRVI
jgi:hypothetical protein